MPKFNAKIQQVDKFCKVWFLYLPRNYWIQFFILSHRWSDWMRNNIKKCIAWHDILRAIYDVLDEIRLKNERSVNSAFHPQQSVDFPLHGCYTASWHLEKQKPFIIFEGLRFGRPHGTFPVMVLVTSWSFFCFFVMSSGYPCIENWMTVQFDTASAKQATTTQRMCKPPRSWNTAQKGWVRNAVGENGKMRGCRIISFASFHRKESCMGTLCDFT